MVLPTNLLMRLSVYCGFVALLCTRSAPSARERSAGTSCLPPVPVAPARRSCTVLWLMNDWLASYVSFPVYQNLS